MAYDIMAPLLLVPDLTTLFAIDLVDSNFTSNNTWDSQKREIKQMLLDGSDEHTCSRKIHAKTDYFTIHYLATKSIILNDNDDGNCWKLQFIYDNIPRTLYYYHHRNFFDDWPNDIQNISHVMTMGAIYILDSKMEKINLISMLELRTTEPYYFYALSFNHLHFPEHFMIDRGQERNGTKIGRIKINHKIDSDLFEQLRVNQLFYISDNDLSDENSSDELYNLSDDEPIIFLKGKRI